MSAYIAAADTYDGARSALTLSSDPLYLEKATRLYNESKDLLNDAWNELSQLHDKLVQP